MNNKMLISIPKNCSGEIEYVIDVVFREFLGLSYTIEISETIRNVVVNVGTKSLTITNNFFSSNDLNLLTTESNIPSDVNFAKFKLRKQSFDLVVFYGRPKMEISPNEVVLHFDLIGSIFYMLSRWEETLEGQRDNHGRYITSASLAFRQGFIKRPIVNEYVEFIWAILNYLGLLETRRVRDYLIRPTHDIDHLERWNSPGARAKDIVSILGQRKGYSDYKLQDCLRKSNDPYVTYGNLQCVAERANSKALFLFMGGGGTKYDSSYSLEKESNKKIIKDVASTGHDVGLHPSYGTYDNLSKLVCEKKNLERILGSSVSKARQHYLRFCPSKTWPAYAASNISEDYTVGYADYVGFRAGVCFDYSAFDLQTRSVLPLKVVPLLIMDVTLFKYMKLDIDAALSEIEDIKSEVKKYNGIFHFLWHNSSLCGFGWGYYKAAFHELYL